MGHACSSGCSNYFGKLVPDTGVQYTGPAIASLGICTGDYLSEVDAVILQKIIDYSTGVGISIPSIDLTTCGAFTGCTLACCNTCTDLPCLLECYKTAICSIFDDVATLKTEVTGFLTGYDVKCLTGVTSTSLVNLVLQELINEFCALVSNFNTLQTTVGGITGSLSTNIGNFLLNALTSCTGTGSVIKTGTGASASIAFKGFTPIGGIMPFGGTTAGKFDGTGLGLAGTDMCGWAMCNGNNGTINMMGQVPVGLTNMGGSLPTNATGLSITTAGTQIGEKTHLLTSTESALASHSHGVTEPNGGLGHQHPLYFELSAGQLGSGVNNYIDPTTTTNSNTSYRDGKSTYHPASAPYIAAYIGAVTSGITINNASASAVTAHNNMQPSTGLLYIQRVS